uniref:Uncharacterized protein n=1 Tax=Avena sativa TaxID=4498 RepID=A0ACD5UQM3_AVESA
MRRPGPLLYAAMAAAVAALLAPLPPAAIAADCPLDLSWPNYALIASVCSDQIGHSKCCRYINAVLAVSSAMYANTTGTLGVPAELADACIGNISDTLVSNGVLPTAASFCGLGIKIQASYQCAGMTTIVQMLQSPNFSDVARSCATSLPDDLSCKRCLNSGLSYLRHLVGQQDNVTLNTCRDAAFVAFVGQGNISTLDTASCFFSVQGLSALQVNISTPSAAGHPAQNISPSPLAAQLPGTGESSNHHHSYKHVLFPAIGALVTGLSVALVVVLILLIRRKSKELEKIEGIKPLEALSSCVKKGQEGTSTIFGRFSHSEMRRATRNFSTRLGGNDNATIFKGQLTNGSVVAVRRVESSPKGGQLEFCKEMEILGRLHHRHLVGLKGYCLTRFERFQVYEYMENGSLKDHLHSPGKLLLPWKNRIQIAIDVANALEYLHFYCDPPLYHGDIKPSNVLLDKNYLAKLAGCGHAHYSSGANTTISSTTRTVKIQATLGKATVYSFLGHASSLQVNTKYVLICSINIFVSTVCVSPCRLRRPRVRGDPGADGEERRVQLRRADAGAGDGEARGAGQQEPGGVVPRAHRHRLPPPRAGGHGGGGHVRPGRAAGDGGRDPLVHPQGRRRAAVDEAGPPDPLRAAGPAVRRVRARRGGGAGVLLR